MSKIKQYMSKKNEHGFYFIIWPHVQDEGEKKGKHCFLINVYSEIEQNIDQKNFWLENETLESAFSAALAYGEAAICKLSGGNKMVEREDLFRLAMKDKKVARAFSLTGGLNRLFRKGNHAG